MALPPGLEGAVVLAAGCPLGAPAPGASGTTAVGPLPSEAARALNNEGKALYRQQRWAEARAKYRAALEADPDFLAPALNAACALARQERFAEAAGEAAALVRRGFVPWGREVREAADLAALHVRPEMRTIEAALAEGGAAWGQSLMDGLFFVARTKPPVRLAGQGVLVLGLNQELYAWLPATGRYRQVTADDGRVLAFVRSDGGRTAVYVRAGKVVREADGRALLRELSLRRLEVPTMTLGPRVELPGDVEELTLHALRSAPAELAVRRRDGATQVYRFAADRLTPQPALSPEARLTPPVRLTAAGVAGGARMTAPRPCGYGAADELPAGQAPRVRVTSGKRSLLLEAPLGAGLHGLPFP
jgi:hypothetical protein